MRKSILLSFVLCLFSIFLPVLTHTKAENIGTEKKEEPKLLQEKTPEKTEKPDKNEYDSAITFKVKVGEEILEMSMDEYLPGVLAAEMPASFPEEALRAQAVAARSFILYRLAHPATDGVHDGAALCSTPSHCKGYINISDPEIAEGLFGAASDIYVEKLNRAVSDTDGEVMLYGGEPILAAFHAISGGMTENACDVWGGNVSYLTSVESPGEEVAEKFASVVEYDVQTYKEKLSALCDTDALGEDPAMYIQDIERSEAGGIIRATVGGTQVKGSALRTALALNSTDFTVELSGDGAVVRLSVTGYGHGVGMSQYGARAMAMEGANYEEILTHYYTGAVLAKVDENPVVNPE